MFLFNYEQYKKIAFKTNKLQLRKEQQRPSNCTQEIDILLHIFVCLKKKIEEKKR